MFPPLLASTESRMQFFSCGIRIRTQRDYPSFDLTSHDTLNLGLADSTRTVFSAGVHGTGRFVTVYRSVSHLSAGSRSSQSAAAFLTTVSLPLVLDGTEQFPRQALTNGWLRRMFRTQCGGFSAAAARTRKGC